MLGDCAANHIKYNGNDVVDCFVKNFILQNNEWWKGNVKINDCVNVSYYAKAGSKSKIFLPKSNDAIKIWMKIDEVN